jgi:hypothetical protein
MTQLPSNKFSPRPQAQARPQQRPQVQKFVMPPEYEDDEGAGQPQQVRQQQPVTATNEFVDRFKQVERVADVRGRIITVGRLRVSQKLKIAGMTQDLEGSYEVKAPDGSIVDVPRRYQPMLAAMVRNIDGRPYMFPTNRDQLDAILDTLDDDGLTAVLEASAKLNGAIAKNEDGEAISEGDQAKNFQGTLS